MSGSEVSATNKNDKGGTIDGKVEIWAVLNRMKMYYKPEAKGGRLGERSWAGGEEERRRRRRRRRKKVGKTEEEDDEEEKCRMIRTDE
jgi:hypothetical protein